jgi:hypothetical protein
MRRGTPTARGGILTTPGPHTTLRGKISKSPKKTELPNVIEPIDFLQRLTGLFMLAGGV